MGGASLLLVVLARGPSAPLALQVGDMLKNVPPPEWGDFVFTPKTFFPPEWGDFVLDSSDEEIAQAEHRKVDSAAESRARTQALMDKAARKKEELEAKSLNNKLDMEAAAERMSEMAAEVTVNNRGKAEEVHSENAAVATESAIRAKGAAVEQSAGEAAKCRAPKCGSNNFCVGFEADGNVYCYGASTACLWGQQSCLSDEDCLHNGSISPKYTDGDTPTCPTLGWRNDACTCRTEAIPTDLQTGNEEHSSAGAAVPVDSNAVQVVGAEDDSENVDGAIRAAAKEGSGEGATVPVDSNTMQVGVKAIVKAGDDDVVGAVDDTDDVDSAMHASLREGSDEATEDRKETDTQWALVVDGD